jgi:maltose alpha-D-glucosyltransferase/alpha-amylase
MPGTPVLRYGEEIGMGEALRLHGREAIRTPMQWEPHPSAGFSTAAADQLVRPVLTRGKYAASKVNVRAQRREADSLLRWFEGMIRVLRECPEIGVGEPSVVDIPLPRSVLVHRFEAPEGAILLLHNLAPKAVSVDLGPLGLTDEPVEVFADTDYGPLTRRLGEVGLSGFGYRWIRTRRGA